MSLPAVPLTPSLTSNGASSITVNLGQNFGSSWKLYYSLSENGSYDPVNTSASTPMSNNQYTFTNLNEGAMYWVKVAVTNACGTTYSMPASL